jgi:hypothetical protein
MSLSADVDGIRFTFPRGWLLLKYDDSSFHRNQFQPFAGGSKALDIVALAPDRTLWLIEVKNYRGQRRSKAGSVFAEVALKVRATLAGLAAARVRANNVTEKVFANEAMQCAGMGVVLHLDQAASPSRLFPQIIDPKSASQQLRRETRCIDQHPVCYGQGVSSRRMPWTTEPV